MSEIIGAMFLTDRQLTAPITIGPGFRDISPHKSKRTQRDSDFTDEGKHLAFATELASQKERGRTEPTKQPLTCTLWSDVLMRKRLKNTRQRARYIFPNSRVLTHKGLWGV